MGVKTDNLPSASVVKEVVAHVETAGVKSLATIPVEKLVTQVGAGLSEDYSTLAELQADLDWNAGALAKVWGDTVLANRGVYQKSGNAGAGTWTRIGPLPETDLSHSLRVPTGESINPFPDAATRANTVPMFDETGQPVDGPTAAEISSAEGYATAAAADRALAQTAKTDAEQAKADAEQAAIDAQNTVLGVASTIDVTPAGSIASTNVQDALEELDSDIQTKASVSSVNGQVAGVNASLSAVSAKADANEADIASMQWVYPTPFANESAVTALDFTAIPSGVGEIDIGIQGGTLSGTNNLLLQLGTASGWETTGYESGSFNTNAAAASLAGFVLGMAVATRSFFGLITLKRFGNTWYSFHGGPTTSNVIAGGGSKILGGDLSQVRLTRDGADTLDVTLFEVRYRK